MEDFVTMRTEKIIQFGEGGFLRGFVDWMVSHINEETDVDASVVVVQPIERGMCEMLEAQGKKWILFINIQMPMEMRESI